MSKNSVLSTSFSENNTKQALIAAYMMGKNATNERVNYEFLLYIETIKAQI